MIVLGRSLVLSLMPSPQDCVKWVEAALKMKRSVVLPPKTSLHFPGDVFFNTMPVAISELNRFGVKEVVRIPGRKPSVQGDILIYNFTTGELLALMDGTIITEWRTGAVAAHSMNLFQRSDARVFSFVGLGATARTTLRCYLATYPSRKPQVIRLFRHKDQAEMFANDFSSSGIHFEIVDTMESLIRGADVIVSCVTAFDDIVARGDWFSEGCCLIPVHTRGFQNCDLLFDIVYADDRGHVEHFQNFSKFHAFAEVADVVTGNVPGRSNDSERILVYNIGIALHDIYFATKLLQAYGQEHEV